MCSFGNADKINNCTLVMLIRRVNKLLSSRLLSNGPVTYTQGQYNNQDPTVREYFYYIDHNGMLFLDDARMKNFTSCFKEQKFLRFFYRNVKKTDSNSPITRYFPYTSVCGKERNYIKVNATPFVFTSKLENKLEYNMTGNTHDFNPSSLYIGSDGRLYHEFNLSKHVTFGLVRSSVADLISRDFVDNTGVKWGEDYEKQDPVGYSDRGCTVELNYKLKSDVEGVLLG